MFGLFRKSEVKRLESLYREKLEKARDLQRNGDIQGFAQATADAERVGEQLEAARTAARIEKSH